MDTFEAEGLLRTIGIDPDAVKVALYRRFRRQAKTHWREGKPLPPLLKQALEDLRPVTAPLRREKELARQARTAVKRVIERVNALPGLLRMESNPAFSMAYRNKKELSDHDKEVLDTVADDLRKRIEDRS